MKTTLTENNLFTFQKSESDTRQFLLLGKPIGQVESVLKKVSEKESLTDRKGIWGTIGWMNNSPFLADGEIQFSEAGQTTSSVGATLNEIKDLYYINTELTDSSENKRVRERYIDLTNIGFNFPNKFRLNDLPVLRLSIFLEPNEGALVYYQHSNRKDYNDEEAFIEYILPEATDDSHSFNRSCLNYSFPILPVNELEETTEDGIYKLSSKKSSTGFIIKVLTFIREGEKTDEVFENVINTINKKSILDSTYEWVHEKFGEKKYCLRIFKPNLEYQDGEKINCGGAFVSVGDDNKIDGSKKTLLLLHGTWSSTFGSFKNLIINRGPHGAEPSFLQDVISNGDYEQVIAFDRPTMSADVYTNINYFFQLLGNITFSQSIDIITTSQGAIVAEALSSLQKTKQHFEIRRVLMFSAANGCGYFKAADRIGLLLSILRKTATPGVGKVLLAVAQHSANWFVSNPGLAQMHPDSDLLSDILNKVPNSSSTKYINVVSDWDKNLIKGRGKIFKRVPAILIDGIIKLALGKKHDWVIGCNSQEKCPLKSSQKNKVEIISMHGKYLDIGHVLQKKLISYRSFDTHEMILNELT